MTWSSCSVHLKANPLFLRVISYKYRDSLYPLALSPSSAARRYNGEIREVLVSMAEYHVCPNHPQLDFGFI